MWWFHWQNWCSGESRFLVLWIDIQEGDQITKNAICWCESLVKLFNQINISLLNVFINFCNHQQAAKKLWKVSINSEIVKSFWWHSLNMSWQLLGCHFIENLFFYLFVVISWFWLWWDTYSSLSVAKLNWIDN